MLLAEHLTIARVLPEMRASDKEGALLELATMVAGGLGKNVRESIRRVLTERELLASTGIGKQIAIPHGKLDLLGELMIGLARSKEGLDFDSVDGKPAHLFFVLVAPETSTGAHLKALARISKLCKSISLKPRLLQAGSAREMLDILIEEEGKL